MIAYNVITIRAARKRIHARRWPASGSSSVPSRSITRSTSTCVSALDDGEWQPGDRLPAGARARRALRLQPDHRPARPDRSSRASSASNGRAAAARSSSIPVSSCDFGGNQSFTDEMQTRGLDPETRLIGGATGVGRASRSRRRSDLELGSPTLVPRAAPARRRRAAAARAGPPARRAVSGLLASDLEHNSLYDLLTERYGDPDRPRPRGARAGPPADPRGPAARPGAAAGPRCSSRAPRSRPTATRRVRPELRPRRPDPLLRRAGRRPRPGAGRRSDVNAGSGARGERRAVAEPAGQTREEARDQRQRRSRPQRSTPRHPGGGP